MQIFFLNRRIKMLFHEIRCMKRWCINTYMLFFRDSKFSILLCVSYKQCFAIRSIFHFPKVIGILVVMSIPPNSALMTIFLGVKCVIAQLRKGISLQISRDSKCKHLQQRDKTNLPSCNVGCSCVEINFFKTIFYHSLTIQQKQRLIDIFIIHFSYFTVQYLNLPYPSF